MPGTKWSTAYTPPELLYKVPLGILDRSAGTDYGEDGALYMPDGTIVRPHRMAPSDGTIAGSSASSARVPGGGAGPRAPYTVPPSPLDPRL